MALPDEQARRLNNLVSAAKAVVPDVLQALDRLENLQQTYTAFQASGLLEEDIEDSDFAGANAYVSRQSWLDFMYAVSVQNGQTAAIRTALLALLDAVPV